MDKTTIYGAVGVFAISCLFVFGLSATNSITDITAPIITGVLSTGGIIVVQVLTSKRVEHKVDRVLNGEMEGKVKNAVVEALNESDPENSVTES